MSVQIQDLTANVQTETKSASESRIKPADWLRWAFDAITEAFNLDGALRLQSDMSILPTPFTVDPNADPATDPYAVPASLLPFRTGLEAYIIFRYHSSDPKNDEERAEASKAYNEFLRCFGVPVRAAPAAQG